MWYLNAINNVLSLETNYNKFENFFFVNYEKNWKIIEVYMKPINTIFK